MFLLDNPWSLPIAGGVIGIVLGFAARHYHFCTMSALERFWYAGDANGLRSWGLAIATALLATQSLIAFGVIDISASFYLSPTLPIAGAIVGGLMFGFGMALVGTCGFGAVLRMGGGSMRAFVVLVGIALAAIAAQRGLTGHVRRLFFDPLSADLSFAGSQSLGDIGSALLGADVRFAIALILGGALMFWVFRDPAFRRDRGKMIVGAVIGLAITGGWIVTSTLSQTLFTPVQIEAGSFVAPLGDTVLQVITVTGELPDYGVGLMVGVFLGAAMAAWWADDMRWEACDDARELGRHLIGAFLMGTGGILALGCTIGQGLSAVSVMAVSTPLAMGSIVLGARAGLGYLIEGSAFAFLRAGRKPAAS